jgi:ribonuclease E
VIKGVLPDAPAPMPVAKPEPVPVPVARWPKNVPGPGAAAPVARARAGARAAETGFFAWITNLLGQAACARTGAGCRRRSPR